jgi:predicted deacylase
MIFNVFIKNVDAYIDLHSGDGFESLMPFAYYLGESDASDKSRQMISCVSTRYYVRSRCKTGGAYNLASVSGIPSVLIERGQLSLFSRQEIEADKADVINILKCLGVIEGEYQTYPKQELSEYGITAPCTGCWYPALEVGTHFFKDEKLGEIRDYFGHVLHTVYAPINGILLYQCASLNIIENGPMISYGVPTGNAL